MPSPLTIEETLEIGRLLIDLSALDHGSGKVPMPPAKLRRLGLKLLQKGICLKEYGLREKRAERTAREERKQRKPTVVAAAGSLTAKHRLIEGIVDGADLTLSALTIEDYASVGLGNQPRWTLPPVKRGKNGRPSASPTQQLLQQYVAASVAILMSDGMREQGAVSFATDLLRKHLGWQGKASTLKDWRATVSAKLGRNGRVRTEGGRLRPGCEAYARTVEDWGRSKGRRSAQGYVQALFTAIGSRLNPGR